MDHIIALIGYTERVQICVDKINIIYEIFTSIMSEATYHYFLKLI